jgi:aspartate aminotransferase
MPAPTLESVDLSALARDPGPHPLSRVSVMAQGLVGSEILRIAGEIRALVAGGRNICDLTVGDFSPRHFAIPEQLRHEIVAALDRGETNYPPSSGVIELRQAVQKLYERDLGLRYPVDSVLVAGGARPVIYAIYRAVCDAGDRVVYPVPSWNNNHYAHMVDAVPVPVPCHAEQRFLPEREALARALPGARLLCLNSPLNPTGTAISRESLAGICEDVLAENHRRLQTGERPLYLMYDHIYWILTFGEPHVTPPALDPEMARYTIFVDGISKSLAATGLRVGWGVGPADVVARMSAILGHVGAWAPRPEQVATVKLLEQADSVEGYLAEFRRKVSVRLQALHRGLAEMRDAGLPVDVIPPAGAIYLTARFPASGRATPSGTHLQTNEDVRRYLLEAAGFAVVPFQAFGCTGDDGWFRLSVGAVGEAEVQAALPRLRAALEALR